MRKGIILVARFQQRNLIIYKESECASNGCARFCHLAAPRDARPPGTE